MFLKIENSEYLNRLPLFYMSDSKKPPTKIHNFLFISSPCFIPVSTRLQVIVPQCLHWWTPYHPKVEASSCSQILGSNSDKIPNLYTLIEFRVIVYWKLTTALIGFGIWFICSNLDHKESVSHMERISKFQKRNGCRLTQYLPNY